MLPWSLHVFSHLGVSLISVKPLTTENTENKTTPKICKITVFNILHGSVCVCVFERERERDRERRERCHEAAVASCQNSVCTLFLIIYFLPRFPSSFWILVRRHCWKELLIRACFEQILKRDWVCVYRPSSHLSQWTGSVPVRGSECRVSGEIEVKSWYLHLCYCFFCLCFWFSFVVFLVRERGRKKEILCKVLWHVYQCQCYEFYTCLCHLHLNFLSEIILEVHCAALYTWAWLFVHSTSQRKTHLSRSTFEFYGHQPTFFSTI